MTSAELTDPVLSAEACAKSTDLLLLDFVSCEIVLRDEVSDSDDWLRNDSLSLARLSVVLCIERDEVLSSPVSFAEDFSPRVFDDLILERDSFLCDLSILSTFLSSLSRLLLFSDFRLLLRFRDLLSSSCKEGTSRNSVVGRSSPNVTSFDLEGCLCENTENLSFFLSGCPLGSMSGVVIPSIPSFSRDRRTLAYHIQLIAARTQTTQIKLKFILLIPIIVVSFEALFATPAYAVPLLTEYAPP
mmetsp:Transcript_19795/g.32840  ORF Transcript_19795/g.32840 Transcript_19795/m.32840 type:complete len:244 (-) Transcript_19795:1608-2339(-)